MNTERHSYLVTVDLHFDDGNVLHNETFQVYATDMIDAEQKVREQMPSTAQVNVTQVSNEIQAQPTKESAL